MIIMNKGKILLGLVISLIAIGIIISASLLNKSHLDISAENTQIVISSNKLFEDFQNDETEANTKYLEQIIQVKGTIVDINIDKNKGVIALTSDDELGNVLCHLDSTETHKISLLHKGQSINIKGVCTGFLMDVILVKSVIIN